MSTNLENVFRLNENTYDGTRLTAEGKQLLVLINESQNELNRLDTQLQLIQAAKQHLINQLKPLLPKPEPSQPVGANGILGHASDQIPTTSVEQPAEEPVPFPENLPIDIRTET